MLRLTIRAAAVAFSRQFIAQRKAIIEETVTGAQYGLGLAVLVAVESIGKSHARCQVAVSRRM